MLQKTSHYMRQANLIGGEWVQADSGATIDVINPATGQRYSLPTTVTVKAATGIGADIETISTTSSGYGRLN